MRDVGGQNYRAIVDSQNHSFETKLQVNGVEYLPDVVFSVETDRAIFEKNMEVGKAVAAQIDVRMLNPNASIPKMARVVPYTRAVGDVFVSSTASLENGILDFGSEATISSGIVHCSDKVKLIFDIVVLAGGTQHLESDYFMMGAFYIDSRVITKDDVHSGSERIDVLSLHGYDRMLFASEEFSDSEDSPNGPAYTKAISLYRNYYHAVHGAYPADGWPENGMSDAIVVEAIASVLGKGFDGRSIEVDGRTWNIMLKGVSGSTRNAKMLNGKYKIPVPIGYTYREILGFIGSAYIGSFLMTEEEKLRLVSFVELPVETNYLVGRREVYESPAFITVGGNRIVLQRSNS